MKNVMVDLETLGTNLQAPVIAIGAVKFDPATGEIGEEFYRSVDIESALLYGKPDGGAIDFWLKQPKQTIDRLYENRVGLPIALLDFEQYIGRDAKVWGNGILFDNAILTNAYNATGMIRPWHFRDDRDVRTLVALGRAYGIEKEDTTPGRGQYHYALDDARYQARYCSVIWQTLMKKNVWRVSDERKEGEVG